jgi:hypothetical protein
MQHLHKREYLDQGDIVVVNCSHQCNIWLMTDSEYSTYSSGRSVRAIGGGYRRFPVRISVPSSGYWNVALDLGGGAASVRHSITFIKRS